MTKSFSFRLLIHVLRLEGCTRILYLLVLAHAKLTATMEQYYGRCYAVMFGLVFVCYAVARILWAVARWLFTGLLQSFYDIFVTVFVNQFLLLFQIASLIN